MAILIIAEKTSQARDLRAALGGRFGQILPAEGHRLRLAEPHEVNASWKSWACVLLKPDGLYPTRPAPELYSRRMSIYLALLRRLEWRDSSAAMASAARPRRRSQMRFMFIVKSAHRGPPTPALMEAMHKLADREIKAGRMLDNGGLMPMATGAQVRITDGELSVVDGPFVEAKEVIGGYAIFELRDKEEALASAKQFMQLHKDLMPGWEGTCELRALASRAA